MVKYTVQPGDTLTTIARTFYGDGNKWKKIYEQNKEIIGINPDSIEPGMIFDIPS